MGMEATTTSASQTRDLGARAREIFSAIFDDRDLSDPYRYWTDDSVDYFLAAGREVRGAAALAEWFRDLFAAVPDWKLTVENTVDDGVDQVVVQWHAVGTFSGAPFLDIEPTGRSLDIRGCDVIRVDADEKVITNTVYYDGAEFARQIGMLPARDSAADRAMLTAFNGATRLKKRLGR
jgi:steroid delta-isomerase-like uncharacterized protein